MNKYELQTTFTTQKGKGEKLAGILLEASGLVSKAKGCHLYLVGMAAEKENMVLVTEVWDSKEAHDASLAIPGVNKLITQAMPLLDGPPRSKELRVLGGL